MDAVALTWNSHLDALQSHLLAMPPVHAISPCITGYDGHRLHLRAPLAANVNDKGSAFGGSLASLMTLAAWGLATLKLREAELAAEVYVQDSQLRYLRPLYAALEVQAVLAPEQHWSEFIATYLTRGKARARMLAEAHAPDAAVVARFEGRFVALRPAG